MAGTRRQNQSPYKPRPSTSDARGTRRSQLLSHNLTLRLSYARFKVENGWTALTLDEIENLWSRPFRAQAKQREEDAKAARAPIPEGEEEEVEEDQEMDEDAALLAGMEMEWLAQSQEEASHSREGLTAGPGPSATALGKRKAVDELLPRIPYLAPPRSHQSNNTNPDSAYFHLDKLPTLAPPPRLHTSLSPTSRLKSSSASSGGGVKPLPNSYDDFWAKLGSPSSASIGATSTTTTTSNHSGPPSSPTSTRSPTSTTQRSPISRKRSPFRPAVILPTSGRPSAASALSSIIDDSGTAGSRLARAISGNPLGSQASFSSLPPPPPLPFPSQTARSHSPESQETPHQPPATRHLPRLEDDEYPSASQDPQEELTMEAIEAAF